MVCGFAAGGSAGKLLPLAAGRVTGREIVVDDDDPEGPALEFPADPIHDVVLDGRLCELEPGRVGNALGGGAVVEGRATPQDVPLEAAARDDCVAADFSLSTWAVDFLVAG